MVSKSVIICFSLFFFLYNQAGAQQQGTVPFAPPPVVLRTIPHDTTAFTQGFLYNENVFYESTGAPRGHRSKLRVLDYHTGEVQKEKVIAGIFAEGLTLFNNQLVQLSWKSEKAFLYNKETLKNIGQHSYRGEGWGLTTMGSFLVMSNGSDTLYILDKDFTTIRKVAVKAGTQPVVKLNELEFARGKIYANIWYAQNIVEIDPQSGTVLRIIPCSTLVEKTKRRNYHDVLNGIAYNKNNDLFYLTGKNWPVIYEVLLQ